MQEQPEQAAVGSEPDGSVKLPLAGPPTDGAANQSAAPPLDVAATITTAAPGRERADAARNRRRVLAAAAELFHERGVRAVSMDDVAARAGVGKGTIFRRFGDRGGLAVALLDERERDLQARILAGPPPLGPDPTNQTAPAGRLSAFVQAYLEFLDASLELVLLSETSTPGARHRTGAHAFWTTHCRLQLQAAAVPDPALRADVLLAALAADQVQHWRRDQCLTLHELTARLSHLARDLGTARPDP